jgi:hypothetical protein
MAGPRSTEPGLPGDSGTAEAMVARSQRRRAVLASTVGTTIEWDDFFLYGTAAALIFPALSSFPGRSRSRASCSRSGPSSWASPPGRWAPPSSESPEFTAVRTERQVHHRPLVEVIRRQPREILTSAFVRLSEQAPFYLFITFVLTYGTEHLQLLRDGLLNDTIVAAAVGLVSVPLFGHLSDLIGRRTMYGIGIVLTGAFAFP